MKAFKQLDHPGQDAIDEFFKEELKKDKRNAKKNNRKSKSSK
jgi:hypothetical protein